MGRSKKKNWYKLNVNKQIKEHTLGSKLNIVTNIQVINLTILLH